MDTPEELPLDGKRYKALLVHLERRAAEATVDEKPLIGLLSRDGTLKSNWNSDIAFVQPPDVRRNRKAGSGGIGEDRQPTRL